MKLRILLGVMPVLVLISGYKNKPVDYSNVLPNTVKVSDHLYYDKSEITNFHWLEYLNWHAQKHGRNSAEYRSVLPDTTVWRQSESYNEPYVKWYLRHKAYHDYPVVGVSWAQARDYCAWRTQRVKEVHKETGKDKKAPYYFAYRLPTRAEWQMIWDDERKVEETREEQLPKKSKGKHHYNLERDSHNDMSEAGQLNDLADVTAPVFSYWPNGFGVYNIKGNVAEWLMEEGTVAGGGWQTSEEELTPDPIQQVTQVSAAIGFRCACEVTEAAP